MEADMRRLALTTLAIFALASPLTGCGTVGASPDRDEDGPIATPQSTPITQPWQTPDGGVLVTCGHGPAFPAAMVAGSGIEVYPDEAAAIVAALADLKVMGGIDAPESLQQADAEEVKWTVLWSDDLSGEKTLGLLLAPSDSTGFSLDTDWYLILGRQDGQWRATSWSECGARPALPEGSTWAQVALPVDTRTPDGATVNLLVSEIECTGARAPGPFLAAEPVIVETDEEITVYWTSQQVPGDATCPDNPWVERTLHLDQNLGDRTLLDGSTWPPTPVVIGDARG
jgi:hypothetical protein